MSTSKQNIVAYISILVIVISLASIGMQFTGYAATDTAIVNVTVSSSAAINFTVDIVEFGSGSVNNGTAGSTLETGQTPVGGTWTGSQTALTLQNIGNVNVTLNLSASAAAQAYLGGTSPTFQYKVSDAASNAGACVNNTAATYTDFTTAGATICSPFEFIDSRDEIDINIKLYIPSDSNVGTQTATITATGTAVV